MGSGRRGTLEAGRRARLSLDPAGGGRDSAEIARRHGHWYAKLISAKGAETADATAATVVKHRLDNASIVVDVGGGYGGATAAHGARAGGRFSATMRPEIAAMDLFVVPTLAFSLLYGFAIVRLGRRELVSIAVTSSPTAEWIARQITEAFPWDTAPAYLIRDRDRAFGSVVRHRRRAVGIRDKPIAPLSPWQNGFAERLIGSIRRECLDHTIVFGEEHLRRLLISYASYYNGIRTHRALQKDARSIARLSGLGF